MGFSSGKSKAKRKAAKQAAAEYWKSYTTKIKPIEGAVERNIDTQSARKLSDSVGDDLSYSTKRIAMEADKVGRSMNEKLPQFKEAVTNYNKRYDILQRQMKGETVSEFEVMEKNTPENKNTDLSTIGMITAKPPANPTYTSLGKMSKAEAYAMAKSKGAALKAEFEKANPVRTGMFNQGNPNGNSIQNYLSAKIPDIRKNDTSFGGAGDKEIFVRETKYNPINPSYRTLGEMIKTGDEITELGDKVNSQTEFIGLQKQYGDLANKLKSKLRRDQGNFNGGTGLIGSQTEVLSGSPTSEVIN
jgi:hypothetical protein